ncbi:MAG: hypothetical protein E6I23_13360 [Chloroflexi bacterium]|nr:MAG: hypothetical protein E6I23_13360 [Chloroflexota bacterium]
MKLDVAFEELLPRPIEAVWAELTDKSAISACLMATDDFKPTIGCRFRMKPLSPLSTEGWVDAEVLELEPPRRMVWSWSVDDRNPPSKVTFMLARNGEGTRLRLRHVGEFDPEVAGMFRDGWPGRIAALVEVITRAEGNA